MATLTGNEPISAANLKAVIDSGGLGGGVLLARSTDGAKSLSLSRNAEDFDRIEVDYDTFDINMTGVRIRQTVCIEPGINVTVGYPSNTHSYIRAAGKTITGTCADSDGREPHIFCVVGHKY